MIVDAHLHLWTQNPEQYPWQPIGDYIPKSDASAEKFLDLMGAEGVSRAVLVQPTPYGWDNSYMLDSAAAYPDRFRAVCLVNPIQEDAADQLEELVEKGAAGLRINWHLQPAEIWDENSYHQALWERALELDIPICLQMTPDYIWLVRKMAIHYSGIRIIIDHLGRPKSGCLPSEPVFKSFLKLAQFPNIYVKLSGLNYYSLEKAPYSDIWPLLQAVKDNFGAQRCIFGSDFPFVTEHWSYSGLLAIIQNQLGFSEDELEWVMGKTARWLWWRAE